MEDLVKTYFEIFSNKDITGLDNIFSDDIILQDWEILAKGKKQTLDANKNIFDSVESISVTLNDLYLDELVAICLIEIIINNEETLKVIDIIKFNDENKIIEVSAYKQ
jgi:hypothetical protein